MAIVLFAIIGATIEAGVGYWICFSVYCVLRFIKALLEVLEDK